MRAVSASGVSRIMLCPASAVLPAADEASEAAQRGTAIHAYFAAALVFGRERALAHIRKEWPMYVSDCAAVDLDALREIIGDGKIESEIAFEYHPETETAAIIGRNIGRTYPVRIGCVYGTADVAIIRDGGRIKILDFKTGHKVEPAAENWQLRTLAVMASRIWNVEEIEVGLVYLWSDGFYVDTATLDAFTLDQAAGELVRTVQRVEAARAKLSIGQVPDVYPSDAACKWCPAKKSCPARGALVKQAMAGSLEIPTIKIAELSNADLASAYKAVVRRYKPIIEAFDDEIKAEVRARGVPLDLDDGTALALMPGRETIDGEIAFGVLEDELGTEAANQAMKLTVTKEAIKKIAKKDAEVMLQLIRDAGGTKIGEPSVREVKLSKTGQ